MIKYYGPIEENVIINPSDDFIKEIIFNKTQDYWEEGSGDSCIEIDDCDERIIFFYNDKYGFFIMRHPDYLVRVNNNNTETITHFVGGEPMNTPVCSYLSRKETYDILLDFIINKSFSGNWVDLYEIDFEHGF